MAELSEEKIKKIIDLRTHGATIDDIIDMLGVSSATIYKYLRANGECHPKAEIDHDQVISMANAGKTPKEIAKALSAAVCSIHRHIRLEEMKKEPPEKKAPKKDIDMRQAAAALFHSHRPGMPVLVDIQDPESYARTKTICYISDVNRNNFTVTRKLPKGRSIEENFTWYDLVKDRGVHVIRKNRNTAHAADDQAVQQLLQEA